MLTFNFLEPNNDILIIHIQPSRIQHPLPGIWQKPFVKNATSRRIQTGVRTYIFDSRNQSETGPRVQRERKFHQLSDEHL